MEFSAIRILSMGFCRRFSGFGFHNSSLTRQFQESCFSRKVQEVKNASAKTKSQRQRTLMRPLTTPACSMPEKLPEYLDASDGVTGQTIASSCRIYNEFITEEEEQSILDEIEPYMKRLRYEYDHWDNAIQGYRETERKNWTAKNKAIFQRVRDVAFPSGIPQLAFIHVLDVAKNGHVKPHVDSVRFCGNTIAGLCLLSPSVMRLVHVDNKNSYGDLLLNRRCLYVISGDSRYKYTHEILPEKTSKFKGHVIPRDRRISIICRNQPAEGDPTE